MQKNKTHFSLLLMLTSFLSGCVTEAPSNYELNRRSGLSIWPDASADQSSNNSESDLNSAKTRVVAGKDQDMPARIPAKTEKIWVFDQLINDDQWMQGTYIFVEVDRGRWLPEVEVGEGNFLESGIINSK